MKLDLDCLVDKSNIPSHIEIVYYVFWEKGVTLEEFNKLPIPYIMSILKTFNYVREKEEAEIKKNARRR